ncbi:MAG: aminoglycoside phosphotransferase family protein [Gemmatimonadetes bacterium]|jgi:5-methylthioribose kinase|nr:aminoglycoside phosphotransferase family protein [Gemmatimonadota bacterium]MBT6148731.1 aminoglycoside phosphotransferase family protein [Gemmatimonadota bacterium]MBT7862657.1 aminoglycoside phosphotransferase family protein [Gemmatimonadota bacterium]
MNLNKNNMTGYLRKKRCIGASEPILDMRQIGDGLKNLVFHVTTPEKRLIVKQAHSRVQIKERWWTDRKRIFAEKNCIEILANVLPPDIFPDAMNEDRTNFILVTTAPSKDAVLWESELAGGRIDLQIAAQAGELLASVHNLTAGVREVKTMFKDLRGFEQLRIEPLYDQVAKSFPEIQKQVDTRAKELMKPGKCLVLADLRPRNVYVNSGELYLVDFATAHYGQPSFDLGFYAADLCLKAMLNHPQKAAFLEAINVFWMAYFKIAEYPKAADTERAALSDFGCLLLSLVAGRAPVVEADDAFRDITYRICQSLLFTELEKIEDITEFINRTLIDG